MALTPTPVYLQDLMTITADINLFNDGIKAQAVSPRNLSPQVVVVQVKDDPLSDALTTGTCDANVLNSVSDSSEDFIADGVKIGDAVVNTANEDAAIVTAVATSVLTLDADICPAGNEAYKVIPATFWVQKFGTGEWKRSNYKDGENKRVTYALPIAGTVASAVVHQVVYPVTAPNNTGNYPPATNA